MDDAERYRKAETIARAWNKVKDAAWRCKVEMDDVKDPVLSKDLKDLADPINQTLLKQTNWERYRLPAKKN